jgi:hypothetical protein
MVDKSSYPHSLNMAAQGHAGTFEERTDEITCLLSTIYGVRSSIIRNFGQEPYNIKRVPIVLADNFKEPLRKTLAESNQSAVVAHPYLYLDLTTVELVKDQNTIKNIHRTGYVNRTITTDRHVSRAFLMPANITLTLHFIDSDIERILSFIELFLLSTSCGDMNFTLVYGEGYEWVGDVSCDSTMSISKASLEDSSMPGEVDVTTELKVATKLGFIKGVYKVNAQAPTLNLSSLPVTLKEFNRL